MPGRLPASAAYTRATTEYYYCHQPQASSARSRVCITVAENRDILATQTLQVPYSNLYQANLGAPQASKSQHVSESRNQTAEPHNEPLGQSKKEQGTRVEGVCNQGDELFIPRKFSASAKAGRHIRKQKSMPLHVCLHACCTRKTHESTTTQLRENIEITRNMCWLSADPKKYVE